MHFLQQLEDRLQALTGQLENFADKIVVPPVQETLDRASTAGKRMTPAGLELTLFDPEQLALKKEADSSRQGPQLKKGKWCNEVNFLQTTQNRHPIELWDVYCECEVCHIWYVLYIYQADCAEYIVILD